MKDNQELKRELEKQINLKNEIKLNKKYDTKAEVEALRKNNEIIKAIKNTEAAAKAKVNKSNKEVWQMQEKLKKKANEVVYI